MSDPLHALGLGFALGLALGALLGWLWSERRARSQPPADDLTAELRRRLAQLETDLPHERAEATRLAAALAAAEAQRAATESLLLEQRQSAERTAAETRQNHERALVDLRDAFRALSAEALRTAHPELLRLANETFARFHETARGDLAQRQQAIAGLVEPLRQQLEAYQQRLQQSGSAQATALGEVTKHLESLARQSETLALETQKFRQVLKSPPARGRWGEETLRRVVEAAGMSAHCDFTEQTQSDDKKPDLIVRLPGDRLIIVDAKVPDFDFLSVADTADPATRAQAAAGHASRLRETIKDLARRDYPGQFPNALDHVVLFLPAESLFSAALEGDRDLIVWAAGRQILLATPASLIALLRSVSISWQQHAQTENARAIAVAAQEFYARVTRFCEHFENLRQGLASANKAYDAAVGSYERMVRPSGERLAHLGGGLLDKELPLIPPLDTALRPPPETAEGRPPGLPSA